MPGWLGVYKVNVNRMTSVQIRKVGRGTVSGMGTLDKCHRL